MKVLISSVSAIIFLLIITTSISANIGFGMTDLQSEVIMRSNEDKACVTYFLYNPGDVPIEGYLDVDRVDGKGLNKLLGLDKLYSQLSELESEGLRLKQQYEEIIKKGESTFEVEKLMSDIGTKSSTLNEQIEAKKPKSSISIPPHTKAKDDNGNFQIPIQICFERPTKKYLFQKIGDTDYCGGYEGEVTGRYVPKATETGATGSAVIGARSTKLRVRVECDVHEKTWALIRFGIAIAIIIILVILIIFFIIKSSKRRKWKEHQNSQYNQTS